MNITRETLEQSGFIHQCSDSGLSREYWARDGLRLWKRTDQYWLVDVLNQGGLQLEFTTMEELDLFWRGCRLPPILTDQPKPLLHEIALIQLRLQQISSDELCDLLDYIGLDDDQYERSKTIHAFTANASKLLAKMFLELKCP